MYLAMITTAGGCPITFTSLPWCLFHNECPTLFMKDYGKGKGNVTTALFNVVDTRYSFSRTLPTATKPSNGRIREGLQLICLVLMLHTK